jgi:hypothetical protein
MNRVFIMNGRFVVSVLQIHFVVSNNWSYWMKAELNARYICQNAQATKSSE